MSVCNMTIEAGARCRAEMMDIWMAILDGDLEVSDFHSHGDTPRTDDL